MTVSRWYTEERGSSRAVAIDDADTGPLREARKRRIRSVFWAAGTLVPAMGLPFR